MYEGHPESKERLCIQSTHLFCCSQSLVSGVQCDVEKCLMQLYIGPCHVVSAEILLNMAVTIDNPAGCEVRGITRFLQADEILHYLDEDASSRKELFCCTTMHVCILPIILHTALLREQFHWDTLEHPPYTPDLALSDFFLFPKMKEHLAGKRFANDENLKDAG